METLARLCVNRPVFATMLIVSLVVAGAFSYTTLGVDLFPQVDLPTVAVTVTNPGASPTEIETEITDIIEESVNTISGIDELRSTSVEGSSQVISTFILEKTATPPRRKSATKLISLSDNCLKPQMNPLSVNLMSARRPFCESPFPRRAH